MLYVINVGCETLNKNQINKLKEIEMWIHWKTMSIVWTTNMKNKEFLKIIDLK